MVEVKIKLNELQKNMVLKAVKKSQKRLIVEIPFEDLLADGNSPTINVNKQVLQDLADAYSRKTKVRIELKKSHLHRIKNHLMREEKSKDASGSGISQLQATSETQLKNYGQQLGLDDLQVSTIDEAIPTIGIINSDTRASGGKHWTAVFSDDKHNFVFDPFGIAPDTRITSALPKGNQIISNTSQIQDMSENACGHHCLRWLHVMNKTRPEARRLKMYKYCTMPQTPIDDWWENKRLRE